MKNNIFSYLIISILTTIFLVSCSKNTDNTPQTCYLSNVLNTKGDILQAMSYDANNRLSVYKNDSAGVTYSFSYNPQNLVDKINVAYKVGSKIYTFVGTITYDASGKATKSVTTLNGNPYQTDVFTFTNLQLTNIISTDSQGEISALRFEYLGDNISKVYQKFDSDTEYLYYEITKFDDKKTIYPEAFKVLAMGFAGLIDDFSYFNKNNTLSEKYYEDDKTILYSSDNIYEYNNTLQPTKITRAIFEDGLKSNEVKSFQYMCK